MSKTDRGFGRRSGRALVLSLLTLVASGCELVQLQRDISLIDRSYVLSGLIANARDYEVPIWVLVLEQKDGRITSADVARASPLGAFAFVVDHPESQYVFAFADVDANEHYEAGEPAWFYGLADGRPQPVRFLENRRARVVGRVSPDIRVSEEILQEAREFSGGRHWSEVRRGAEVPVLVGEVASLDDPRFSAQRGREGLWKPASFPVETGVGIFFLEEYDPRRIPILFIHGAGGSPQDWRAIVNALDKDRFQAWFYVYPTGRRIGEVAEWLDNGVTYLHDFYEFDSMAVVAHSMGGLVARAFLNRNVMRQGAPYVDVLVTLATPWGGHEAAGAGVERSPVVMPSWYDLAPGSVFLKELFADPSPALAAHHLLFAFAGSRSRFLPESNDGTVSVASQVRPEAQAGAARLYGFDATHVGVLSDPAAIATVGEIMDEELAEGRVRKHRGRSAIFPAMFGDDGRAD